jgi:hypothetical protein
MVERNYVAVTGGIRMPYGAKCAMDYTLSEYDVENIGDFTRENVEAWLLTHSGDFSSIDGWYATIGDKELVWTSEEAEMQYSDCMWPCEAE